MTPRALSLSPTFAMTTVADFRCLAYSTSKSSQCLLFPATNCQRKPLKFPSSARIYFGYSRLPIHCTRSSSSRSPFRFRCSIAEESTIAPYKVGGVESQSVLDCVVIGAGISGLCIAHALATKHAEAPNFIVTEARDRVGGNITTVEKDGFLWEEGPNSFQPSDSMLTLVVRFFLSFQPSFYFEPRLRLFLQLLVLHF